MFKKIIAIGLALVLGAPSALALSASQVPTSIPIPWANSASSPYITVIPTLSQIGITPGRASFTDGFPPLNFQPVGSGGIPPFGGDFNGIFNQLSAGLRWLQAGGPVNWNSAYSTTIGGYPNGALVQSATTVGLFWLSTVDNNASNPDTGGAGWVAVNSQHGRASYQSSSTGAVAVNRIRMKCWGGGGGGGGSGVLGDMGAAGGGGEYREGLFNTVPAELFTITVGAGGTAGTTGGGAAGPGGDSIVSGATSGVLIRCKGAGGGLSSNGGGILAGGANGAGGTGGTGGDFAVPGGAGGWGWAFAATAPGIAITGTGGSAFGAGSQSGNIGPATTGALGATGGVFPGSGGNSSYGGVVGGIGHAGAVVLEW